MLAVTQWALDQYITWWLSTVIPSTAHWFWSNIRWCRPIYRPWHYWQLISQLPVNYSVLVVTCDQASLYFRGGKECLIQLLDYLSVASPESGLFSDWSRNKRYLELTKAINRFPAWQCDFRSKKSRELMNSIMTSDEASEVLSKMNKCIHRIVCHGRDVLAVLPTGLAKSATYQLISKVLFRLGCTTSHQKPPQNSLSFVGLQSGTVPSPSSASETNSL